MQVYEGSDLTFEIPNLFKNMDYNLVVKYEHLPQYPNNWQNASVELIRINETADPRDVIHHG